MKSFNAMANAMTNILSDIIGPNETIVLAGDFNLPDINWSNNTFPIDDSHDLFMHSISNFGLHQFVTEPTRFSNTGTANTLDLLFSNDPWAIVVTNYLPAFSTSDHVMIEFSTFLPFQDFNDDPEPIKLSVYDWSVGDYQAMGTLN